MVTHAEKRKQIEELKSQINLAHYLATLGYKRDKAKSSRKWLLLEKEGDKVLVLSQKNDQGLYYYQSVNNERDRGTIVDFLKNRGQTFDEIRKISHNYSYSQELEDRTNTQTKRYKNAHSEYFARRKLNSIIGYWAKNYLTRRGIYREIIEEYKIKTNKEKAIFPLHLHQTLVSTIEYNREGKFFQKGLGRGLVYLGNRTQHTQVVVHESPIDALSYEQLARQNGNNNNRLHICTCGSLTKPIITEIKELCKKENKPTIIAFDNDIKGDKMAEKLKKEIETTNKIIRHKAKQAKDFNEVLTKGKEKGRLAGTPQK